MIDLHDVMMIDRLEGTTIGRLQGGRKVLGDGEEGMLRLKGTTHLQEGTSVEGMRLPEGTMDPKEILALLEEGISEPEGMMIDLQEGTSETGMIVDLEETSEIGMTAVLEGTSETETTADLEEISATVTVPREEISGAMTTADREGILRSAVLPTGDATVPLQLEVVKKEIGPHRVGMTPGIVEEEAGGPALRGTPSQLLDVKNQEKDQLLDSTNLSPPPPHLNHQAKKMTVGRPWPRSDKLGVKESFLACECCFISNVFFCIE